MCLSPFVCALKLFQPNGLSVMNCGTHCQPFTHGQVMEGTRE